MEPLRPWLRRTHRLAKHLRRTNRLIREVSRIQHDMDKIENSYAPMRNEYYQDENKEAIDRAFSELMAARQTLCNPAVNGASEFVNANLAGGSRPRRRRSRGRRTRRHH